MFVASGSDGTVCDYQPISGNNVQLWVERDRWVISKSQSSEVRIPSGKKEGLERDWVKRTGELKKKKKLGWGRRKDLWMFIKYETPY